MDQNNWQISCIEVKGYVGILTIDEPLNQLFCMSRRPPLLLNGTENARSLIFLEHVEIRVRPQGIVLGKKATNGFAIDFASGEVDESLAIFSAVVHHRKCIHEVAVDGVQRTGVVISWCPDRSQVDDLHKSASTKEINT